MILHDYLRVLRRGWWVLLLLTLVGALSGAALAYTTPPTYSTRATLLVAVTGSTTPGDLQQGNVFAMQRVATYADLATTSAVLDRAVRQLGDGTDVSDLSDSVTSAARVETSLIDINTSGGDPGATAARANAVANALAQEVEAIEAQDALSPLELTVVESAEVPTVAVTPQPRNSTLVGGLIGLALGVGLVVVARALDTRIHSAGDLPRWPGLATLTAIPSRRARPSRGVSASDARLESFRNLRANLQFNAREARSIAVAGVTSASDAQTVATQLGSALAEIGCTVVVVDVDLRTAAKGKSERSGAVQPGVSDVLGGSTELDAVVTRDGSTTVSAIGPGNVTASSGQLISTQAMSTMLDTLLEHFDYVLLACPPVVERSEATVAAALADDSLLVVRAGATKRAQFLFALDLLSGVRVQSLNVVIDEVRELDPHGSTLGGPAAQLAGATTT